jgi:hypothetical protein
VAKTILLVSSFVMPLHGVQNLLNALVERANHKREIWSAARSPAFG